MSQSAAVWCCTSCGAVYHKDFPRCPSDGAEVQLALRDPLLDQSIGNYVIDRLIGEGGMGRVYAAHHATLPAKRYAIKVLLGDVAATSSMRRRFAKEADSASKLDHPNIVHVTDFGEMASGLPYIVMDYIDGVALTTLFDGCAMDPARVIRIARAIAEGLAYAHDAGVVHRDLKPDNIMVVIASDGSEVPRIADFGLATTIEHEHGSRLTTTGMAMGTPAYAAPEQMAGKRVDRRADLYSLGMTMFEMLTGGKLPFEGGPLEVMSAKAHTEAPKVGAVAPAAALPRGLEDLVAQLIRRKQGDRPASAREVCAALDRIAHGLAGQPGDLALHHADGTQVAQRDAKTLGVRRKLPTWPWLMVAGAAFGAVLGWGYHRGHMPSGSLHSAAFEQAIAMTLVPRARPASAEPAHKLGDAVDLSAIDIDIDDAAVRANARDQTNPGASPGSVSPSSAIAPRGPAAGALARADGSRAPRSGTSPPMTLQRGVVPEITHVDVSGSLSRSLVRHAVERVMPAIHHCAASAPKTVQTHFTIDESRRAQNVRGTSDCVVAALGGVRIDTVPDPGDAEVDVQIRFTPRP